MTAYRVWFVHRGNWRPGRLLARPAACYAIAPALPGHMPLPEALAWAATHNEGVLHDDSAPWAVVVPVEIIYSGDIERGAWFAPPPILVEGGERVEFAKSY